MKQTPNNKATAKQAKKQRKAEADARRRTNKRWERVETSDRYRNAATEELCNVTTNKIEIEVLDTSGTGKPQEAWSFRRSHLNAHHPCMHKQVHEGYKKEKIHCLNFQK